MCIPYIRTCNPLLEWVADYSRVHFIGYFENCKALYMVF